MSAPSLAIAMVASTKPRWLRHITATESPSRDTELARAPAPARWCALHLAAGQLAELVDQADPVGLAGGERGEAAGGPGAPVARRPADAEQLRGP